MINEKYKIILVCYKGRPYNTTLKLSGCAVDEFTCGDGQCISITNRCDQIINCRDKTDEKECRLLVLDDGYNKDISPFDLVNQLNLHLAINKDFQDELNSIIPVRINISTNLQTVIDISEQSHIIELKFEIYLEWYEYRAKFYNLKNNPALNVLSDDEIRMLWLPYVIFKVTIFSF